MSTKLFWKEKKDDDDSGKKLRKCTCKWALNVKYKNACLFPQFGFVCVSGQIHTKNCSVSQLCWVLSLRKSSPDSEGLPGWQMIKASTTCLTLWSFLLELNSGMLTTHIPLQVMGTWEEGFYMLLFPDNKTVSPRCCYKRPSI